MKEKIKSYIAIVIVSLIISIPLFNPNYNIYIDDGVQHICRLMGTYQSITEGQTFPVIMSNFCNGFGYSWNLFYSVITAYVPLLFKLFTSSFVVCIKIFMLFVTILSGIAMYEFLYKVTKNKNIAILGAVIYISAPYRLTDMYIRMALSELTSFIFLPIIFHGLYNIFSDDEEDKKKTGLLLASGAIGLILSHTVIAMYTAIISAIYVCIHIKKLKDKNVLKKLCLNAVLIICVTSFFWLPMLEQKNSANYEVFKEGRMERTEVLIYYKLDFLDLFYTEKGKMIFEIGLITVIGVLFTALAFKKVDSKYKKIYIFSLVMGIISIIMSLKIFPFEKLPSILKMMQFSFRMLEFSSFFLAFVVAINYGLIINKFNVKDVIVLIGILMLLTIPFARHVSYKKSIEEGDLWPAVSVTENTKRVHAGCASFEYLPSKAFDNLDYIKTRENKVYITQGDAVISNEQKDGTNMQFDISNIENNAVLELPYIYYLGYDVTINGNKLDIYESDKGFIEVHLENVENGTVKVKYTGTNIMKISMIVSIMAFSLMILYYCRGAGIRLYNFKHK